MSIFRFRPLWRGLCLALCATLWMAAPALTHAGQKGATASQKSSAKAKKPSSAKPKSSAAKRGSGAARSASAGGRTCYETVKRKGKSVRVKTPCPSASSPVLTRSPIHERALQESGTPLDGSPVKARSAPIRAYAVDGGTFFHNGRKYKVDGLGDAAGAGLTHDHAAHRLQQILDSGHVSLEPIGADDTGAMRALVKVDGRNVAELLRAKP